MCNISETIDLTDFADEDTICKEMDVGLGIMLFVGIACMFFAQHHVCDSYFVPAINVFVEKMSASSNTWVSRWGEEAVAGATICALGCNGPELFTNLISLYIGCDEGSGVIVGSEVFNLLVIIGCTILTAPETPLQLDPVPFARDCFFYAVSICLLYNFLMSHHVVTMLEAIVLVCCAVTYIVVVYFTEEIENQFCSKCKNKKVEAQEASDTKALAAQAAGQKGRMHGFEVDVKEIFHGRWTTERTQEWILDDDAEVAQPLKAGMDEDGASLAASFGMARKIRHTGTTEFQFLGDPLAVQPVLKYSDLREVTLLTDNTTIEMEFRHGIKRTTLQVTVDHPSKREALLTSIEEHSLNKPWVHKYDPTVFGAINHLSHAWCNPQVGCLEKLFTLFEFLVDAPLRLTLFWVDVRDLHKANRWPLCFLGAMFWLAVFSFSMLQLAVGIEHALHLNPAFVGLTICAVGTSFPNAIASILLSQAGKPGAAVASALGSNVQNVFLAMGLPWVIYTIQHGGASIPQHLDGIAEGVAWMFGTLCLVVVFSLAGRCSFGRCAGYVFVSLYLFFLVYMSGEVFMPQYFPKLIVTED